MPLVKCKVGWATEGWSYIELVGEQEPKYTRVPSSIIVVECDDNYIYTETNEGKCVLRDIRYAEYDFINFKIRDDQFVEDKELEKAAKNKYDEWCLNVYREVI
ncbi:hypothetical protein M3649_03690 [Ureibacillus chungkukjangi]|uniref:hypothetical protein n=1 Tax=Ureibacillus chungkukjangi TaxID=1202712 RepID=UPI002042039D|nr:hypothetical protein [Ureibacillus chungkukjangi]MCM3387233.1 hypothetical protein [Ureibacillus chungkukjangi]